MHMSHDALREKRRDDEREMWQWISCDALRVNPSQGGLSVALFASHTSRGDDVIQETGDAHRDERLRGDAWWCDDGLRQHVSCSIMLSGFFRQAALRGEQHGEEVMLPFKESSKGGVGWRGARWLGDPRTSVASSWLHHAAVERGCMPSLSRLSSSPLYALLQSLRSASASFARGDDGDAWSDSGMEEMLGWVEASTQSSSVLRSKRKRRVYKRIFWRQFVKSSRANTHTHTQCRMAHAAPNIRLACKHTCRCCTGLMRSASRSWRAWGPICTQTSLACQSLPRHGAMQNPWCPYSSPLCECVCAYA